MDKIVLKSTLERLVGYIKAAISGKADASELKDVKKQVENKADLVDGKVPLAQLGNIDTQVMLVVDKLPNTDIKANKIYLVKNTDSTEDQNVYTEYVYVNWKWEKLGEFKPEVDLSHIEAKLETKANITDVDNRLDDLQNYCFKLGDDGSVAAPYKHIPDHKSKLNVQTLKNDKEYTYAGINGIVKPDGEYSIYDKTLGKNIEITTSNNIVLNQQGSFFRTSEPLDLTHTFYLDNEKTGIIENLTQLTIEESNIFANIPYVEVKYNLDDGTVPQYIYDATDNKWIEVAETFLAGICIKFNTKEPLDLTHEFYVNILGFWTNAKENSIALGYDAASLGTGSIALGYRTRATGDNSLVLGTVSNANGKYAISIGNTVMGTYDDCIAIGNRAEARFKSSLALGAFSRIGGNYAIALGKNVSNTKSIFGVGFNGVNGIDMDRDNYGLYLKGFGGYDGTNLVVKSGNTETLNPNIKSVQQTINEKADTSAIPTKVSQLTNDAKFITEDYVKNSIIVRDNYNINGLFDKNTNSRINISEGNSIYLGFNNKPNLNLSHNSNSVFIGNNNNCKGNRTTQIGRNISTNADDNICIGDNISSSSTNNIIIGSYIQGVNEDGYIGIGFQVFLHSNAIYQIAGRGSGWVYNLEETLNYVNQHKKYIYGIGGYDGTNINAEGVKSLQEVLADKADVSAIPTKISQLTNDAKFIAPHTNSVLSGLTVTSNAKIKFIQKSGGSGGTYLVAETVADRVANKVFAADGSLFDVSKLVKRVQCNISGDINNIEFGYTTVDGTYNFSVVPTVTTKHGGIMSPADKVKLDKLQELVELKIVGTSESSVAMKPNKVYEITVGSALTITLEEPTDKTVYNEYQGTFDTGDTIPTVTFPSNVRWNDTPKVGANQHVEFSIRYSGGNYYGICQVWDMTTEQSV